jgi:hypothetical protein
MKDNQTDDIVTILTCRQCGLIGSWAWKHNTHQLKEAHESTNKGHTCITTHTTQQAVIKEAMKGVEGKICQRCKHQACPFCTDWCDTLINTPDGDIELCCDGECVYN